MEIGQMLVSIQLLSLVPLLGLVHNFATNDFGALDFENSAVCDPQMWVQSRALHD
jgi:hypothetical protein